MIYDLEKDILKATAYKSGYVNEEDKYVISASMVAKEPLQNYLSIVYGKVEADSFNDATLGSVFHRGMEIIMHEKRRTDDEPGIVWGIEHSMDVELSNGWVLSGTADLILQPIPGHFEIRDYKTTKAYAHTMFKKDVHNHDYTKQLQVLEALFREGNSRPAIIGSVTLVCDYFIKDAKALEFEKSHRPEVVPNRMGTEDVNASNVLLGEIVEITNKLQEHIEGATLPLKCKDTWPRKVKGHTIHIRCQLYCSHNKVCPYYDATTRTSVDRISAW